MSASKPPGSRWWCETFELLFTREIRCLPHTFLQHRILWGASWDAWTLPSYTFTLMSLHLFIFLPTRDATFFEEYAITYGTFVLCFNTLPFFLKSHIWKVHFVCPFVVSYSDAEAQMLHKLLSELPHAWIFCTSRPCLLCLGPAADRLLKLTEFGWI